MVQFYSSPAAEVRAIRRSVARVGCSVRRLEVRRDRPGVAGSVVCDDGWGAAWLLLALAEEDAATVGARRLAAQIRARAPSDAAFARAIHSYVLANVRFALEEGEIFQSGAFTLNQGFGDCDDHARLVYALAVAGGLPALMGFLHHGPGSGPAHAAALLCPRDGDGPEWAETTVAAHYGENPNGAAERLGLTSTRTDIAKEVVTMSSKDLPPVPPHFLEHNPSEQVSLDVEALQRLGYLSADCPAPSDPSDPVFREAILAFQLASGLSPDGLVGPNTRAAYVDRLEMSGLGEGFSMGDVTVSAPTKVVQTKHLSDGFFRYVIAMAKRFQAQGATATAEDFLNVWLAESGIRNIPNAQGYPYGGLNQMGLDEQKSARFIGTFADWLALTAEQQVPFVERFYVGATTDPKTGVKHPERMRDAASLYLINFTPAFSAHAAEPDFVIFRRDAASPLPTASEDDWAAWRKGHRRDPYAANRGFDTRRDGTIRVRDLAVATEAAKKINAPRVAYWNEVLSRLKDANGGVPSDGASGSDVAVKVAAVGAGALALVGVAFWRGWL